jgi:hypothetical protein
VGGTVLIGKGVMDSEDSGHNVMLIEFLWIATDHALIDHPLEVVGIIRLPATLRRECKTKSGSIDPSGQVPRNVPLSFVSIATTHHIPRRMKHDKGVIQGLLSDINRH